MTFAHCRRGPEACVIALHAHRNPDIMNLTESVQQHRYIEVW